MATKDISSISLIVDHRLWFHSVIQTGDLPLFLQILQIHVVVSSEDSGKTFVYVFFLFDSQECPSGRVFTRGSTIVFAPCIHANKW